MSRRAPTIVIRIRIAAEHATVIESRDWDDDPRLRDAYHASERCLEFEPAHAREILTELRDAAAAYRAEADRCQDAAGDAAVRSSLLLDEVADDVAGAMRVGAIS